MVTLQPHGGSGNGILDRLPEPERRNLSGASELVELSRGQVLCDAGGKLSHVYFPRRGVVALFARVADSLPLGVGMVRTDGMLGLDAAAGRATSQVRAVAQAGLGDRVEVMAFRRLLPSCPALQSALFAYACATNAQTAQNVACVALHPSERRVARWMLDLSEATPRLAFHSTQAVIAATLGMQRPAVNRIAAELQRSGLIRYLRGEVTIVDRPGLRAVACRCSLRPGARAAPQRPR